jgi:formylglycine-generating enzyme required for sulfatase activity
LSFVGDPRLRKARVARYGPDSGYFCFVPAQQILIGTDHVQRRSDDAKPVLPYRRQRVRVGPVWVGNFLVTNELYREFWNAAGRDSCFESTGGQWVTGDPHLLQAIRKSFDVAATRCFWKEVRDKEAVAAAGLDAATPIVEIARTRALRQGRVVLWDPGHADDRFSKPGCPVVGVTWWEALAYCKWWETEKLPLSDFPAGSRVGLLTDWEWEAVRRLACEPPTLTDAPQYPLNRYPAHLRRSGASAQSRQTRADAARRPLHVGLYGTAGGAGPVDLVGNVWEWTRSRVYGHIKRTRVRQEPYGATAWTDSDPDSERTAQTPWRDVIDEKSDLTYRAVRGSSFFSVDGQAAWNPAYRLCDPPYSSYFDLGFRIAIYPGTPS